MTKEKYNISPKIKQYLTAIVSLVVLGIIFVGILPRLGDYESALESIKGMSTGMVALLVVFLSLNIYIYTLPFMAALPGLKFIPAFVSRQSYFVMSNAVPGGGAFGIGLQLAMLKSYGFNVSKGSSAVIVTGVWNMLATMILPGVAALALIVSGQMEDDFVLTALIAIVISTVVMIVYALIFRSEKLAKDIGKFIDRGIKKVLLLIKSSKDISIKKAILEFRETSYDVTRKRWLQLAFTNILQQLSQYSLLFVALYALEPGSISISLALWSYAIAKLGSFIPLTPGGLGTVDALLVGLLVQNGVSNDAALAATLVWRATTFIPQLCVGIVSYFGWVLSRRAIS